MKQLTQVIIILVISILVACTSARRHTRSGGYDLTFTATPAPDWNALFRRNDGWFGGDGLFSISFNGLERKSPGKNDSVLLWFSDTMIGEIRDSLLPGDTMINNTVAVMHNSEPVTNNLRFYWKTGINGKPETVFRPASPNTVPGEYYWLGDGFVNQARHNDIYIFGYRIMNIPGKAVFGFKQTGNTLIRVPAGERPPFANAVQLDLPRIADMDPDSSGSFGSALLVNTKTAGAPNPDGYLYVYGIRGMSKQVIVARVKPGLIEDFEQWTYWNGKDWSHSTSTIQPIADRASNEMSVTALNDGRYIMIFQKDAISTKIGMRIGSSPVGPFGPVIDVYDVKDDLQGSPNLFSYNAKAHPVLSAPGELLISYHINSFNFNEDIRKFPHLYAPRFIRLNFK